MHTPARLLLSFLVAYVLHSSITILLAQDSSCLCLPIFSESASRRNIDSITIDTCGLSVFSCVDGASVVEDNRLKNRVYSKYRYDIEFNLPAIMLSRLPVDSIVDVRWEEIDPFYSELRSGMAAIEYNYGSYYLRKIVPNDSLSQLFELRLLSYAHAESIVEDLNKIAHVEANFRGSFYPVLSIGQSASLKKEVNIIAHPQPAFEHLTISGPEPIQSIELYDIFGREIRVGLSNSSLPSDRILINLMSLPSGIFYLIVNGTAKPILIH